MITAIDDPRVLRECALIITDRHRQKLTTKRCVAQSYYKAGDLAAAQKTYLEYLNFNPDDEQARLDLIRIYLRRQRPNMAKTQIRALLGRNPSSAPAYRYLGLAEFLANNCRGATAAYEQAVKLDPDDRFNRSLLTSSRLDKCREREETPVKKPKKKKRKEKKKHEKSNKHKKSGSRGRRPSTPPKPAPKPKPPAVSPKAPPPPSAGTTKPGSKEPETEPGPFEHHPPAKAD
ncbi:tetratricopeptide repeat protein [Candidatus Thiosymbion oneisti]|uniref:tetratricopeptide repeat protein n=1 Tax=Candidatus Thiosymbion oneisti TaxID=589554 RepID=UPI0013FD2E3D|nr:tetratricopeptide repeat protein [Candidatus Thiosymbion oneisti]